ncbi:hypothetical protein [Pseudotabrizicola algicola]|uniref:Translocase n=1 Tax=Pseudotabrizicola algicola TaxID=2709381 RepID=A0A6B3RY34_9RHOB|nr:hypothetical protein [Pseudotabrizicola algicola]NEX48039.1 hypothetical protein [Pseudotabrizicola algicola]
MNLQRKLTLMVATGAIALGAGHYVQEKAGDRANAEPRDLIVSDIKPVAAGPGDTAPSPARAESPVLPAEAAPIFGSLPPLAAPPAEPAAPVERLAAADPAPAETPAPLPAPDLAASDCDVKFDLVPQSGAVIGLSLLAPCHADQRVVVKHAGLAVTARTSGSGALSTTLPALTGLAVVEVGFADGTKAQASLPVPDFANVQRFAVQWQDKDSFQLHAFENGAGYNQPGHISAAFTGTSGETGSVLTLGDPSVALPLLAEVYTFGPTTAVDLVLEAAVTDATCNREILGEAILATGGSVEITDLNVSMPTCDAVGDILVLKNLLQDMTLAIAD